MNITDLLVYMDNSESRTSTVRSAQKLAEQFNAHLTGLYVVPPVYIPVYSGAAVPTVALAEMEERVANMAKQAEQDFEKMTSTWQSRVSWISAEGEVVSVIKNQARNHDLVVMGRLDPDGDDYSNTGVLEQVILESGRPVLIVPQNGIQGEIGKRILVAWNGKREAVRAIHDALPFLKLADAVDIVSVNAPMDEDIPCAEIAVHLARHGVPVETEKSHVHKHDVGIHLLSLATTYGADMIVMGAYGHSRVREIVLGGATRHILNSMSVPVLMSH
jgi:nucleotide-binding universal stress UspA family protein